MKYGKGDAKDYARRNLRGIWAATLTPFTPDLRLDQAGWRRNLRHWYRVPLTEQEKAATRAAFQACGLTARERTAA